MNRGNLTHRVKCSGRDGEIPAKFGVRGLIPFEVPAETAVKFIRLQGNITANGALVKLKVPAAPAPAP